MLKGNNNDEQMLYLASPKIAANFNLSFMKEVLSFFPCSTWHCKLSRIFFPFFIDIPPSAIFTGRCIRNGCFFSPLFGISVMIYKRSATAAISKNLFLVLGQKL